MVYCYEQHRQQRGKKKKKNEPDCSLPLKVMQAVRYTMSFSHSKGSSYDCKTSAITQGLFHEVSQGHQPLQNQQKAGTARILPSCHDWLAEPVAWGKPACCSHHAQHCLNSQTGGPRRSMAGLCLGSLGMSMGSTPHAMWLMLVAGLRLVFKHVSFMLVPLPFFPSLSFYHLARKRLTPNSSQSTSQHTWTTCQYKQTPCD